jgi:hypothetical protein
VFSEAINIKKCRIEWHLVLFLFLHGNYRRAHVGDAAENRRK